MGSAHYVSMHNIDWPLLCAQKRCILGLFDRASDEEAEHLEGLLCLIDHIQDTCEEQGADVVWLTEGEE